MKRRSHRLPIEDTPHDDWVEEESWTVDCVCGVNFDDGEEMVNCDECGVWVHTRCSRYVKGEKSFACHKCKGKNDRDDNEEETEVAQLLVELPTKTLRMDENPYSSSVAPRRPVRRLWTEIPIEERVHVQGVPGGDPSLFAGLSSVFSPQLWKCTGYVPKKFNFQYREFPSWDAEENEEVTRNSEENGNTNTAGVFFSLLEENKSPTPLVTSVVVKNLDENDKREKVASPEQRKKLEGEDTEASLTQNTVNEDPRLLLQPMMNSVKRKKEDTGSSEDHGEKKKARILETEGDSKKKATLASRTVASTISSDREQLELYKDRGPEDVNSDSRRTGYSRNSTPTDHLSNGSSIGGNNAVDDQKNAAANEHGLGAEILNSSRRNAICDRRPKEDDDDGYQVALKVENTPTVNDVAASGSLSVKDEAVRNAVDSSNGNWEGLARNIGTDLQKSDPIVEDMAVTGSEVEDNKFIRGSNGDFIFSSSDPNAKGKECGENHAILNVQRVSLSEVTANNSFGNVKMNDAAISSSEASDQKVNDVEGSPAEGDGKKDDAHAAAGDCQPKREPTGSEGSLDFRRSSSGQKHGSKASEEKSKLGDTTSSSDPNQRKVVVSVGKCSSLSSASVISKSSTSGSRSCSKVQLQSKDVKQRDKSDGSLGSRRENTSFDVVRDEERSGRSKKIRKEVAKSSLASASKTSQSSKFSHTSVHKRSLSDSNDSTLHSSSKASKAPSVTATPGSGKSASPLQIAGASSVQIKDSDSGLPHKGEKNNLPGAQLSSRVNTSQMQPLASSNPPATLSDEELALLLHQQLNSSPRVPRVPRMRHAGSLPQLTSPTAASMLLKRTSSSGGKDNSFTNRRKPKDSAKDGSPSSRDVCSESKKMDRVVPPDKEG